jgi:hypothetical protein
MSYLKHLEKLEKIRHNNGEASQKVPMMWLSRREQSQWEIANQLSDSKRRKNNTCFEAKPVTRKKHMTLYLKIIHSNGS